MNKQELAIWIKTKEMDALALALENEDTYSYWDAKAMAFSEVWAHLVFDGKEPHPLRYNQENDYWSRVVEGLASVDES